MKRLAVFGILAIMMALLWWLHGNFWMSDAEVYQKLTGIWTIPWSQNANVTSELTFGPHGAYTATITNRTNGWVLNLEGKWTIHHGSITEMVTKSSQTNAVLPHISRGQIVRLDDRELVTAWADMGNNPQSVAHKISP